MMHTNLSSYNNDWYAKEIGAPRWKQFIWYFINILFFINPFNPLNGIKIWWLKRFGAVLGKGIVIKPAVNIKYPWKLTIGDNSWVGEKVWIDNLAQVFIGKNVCLSQGAMLLTGNHNYKKSSFDLMVAPIVLEDGAWIGAHSVVCPGITVGTHAVLTVQSVAAGNLEAFGIYQGNPALKVKVRTIS
jgi:putative colanic acid biosynthesis acetyltransferase WcaF